jgi:NADH:ubiquinone oxidoreductase subunit H
VLSGWAENSKLTKLDRVKKKAVVVAGEIIAAVAAVAVTLATVTKFLAYESRQFQLERKFNLNLMH